LLRPEGGVVRKLNSEEVARLLEVHSAAKSPGFLLWRASLRWQRAVGAALKEESLTHVQFLILSTIWWFERNGYRPSHRDVSDHASLDQAMMSQVARQLEKDGLIVRTVDQADGRMRRLGTTPLGRGLAERSVALMDAADQEFFEEAGPISAVIAVLGPLARLRDPSETQALPYEENEK
jgi:DNA-binding MarR family transcriptional regulator